MQERAANLGYDWPSIDGVLDKVREEVGELAEAEDEAHRAEELGDLLFVLVNVGRKTGIEVEAALRAANDKFRRRFRHVERLGRGSRRGPPRLLLRGARRALGRRQGVRARGGNGMSIGNRPYLRADGRGPNDIRPIEITLGVQKWAEGSCIIRFGDTQVLCAATIEDRVPPHLRGKGTGWVTGTYEMLPRATAERSERESAQGQDRRPDPRDPAAGRDGRLRGVVDLPASASGPSPSTATSSSRTAARGRRRSPAATWPSPRPSSPTAWSATSSGTWRRSASGSSTG